MEKIVSVSNEFDPKEKAAAASCALVMAFVGVVILVMCYVIISDMM
jgi:hypothetical protein